MYNSLQILILPKYIKWYHDFEEIALVDDKKGLHIIDFIYQTRGQKKYDGYLARDTGAQAQLREHKFNRTAAEAMMRKKEITSRYTMDFSGFSAKLAPQKNIFVFKNVSNLEYKRFLQPKVCQF